MAKCPVCKTEQKGYNWTTTKNNKKWLQNTEGKWHDCPASTSKFSGKESKGFAKWEKRIPLIDKDFEFCDMCAKWFLTAEAHEKYKMILYESIDEHKQKYHPNNEILDSIDEMILTDEQKDKMRILWKQPKRTTKYIRLGKVTK